MARVYTLRELKSLDVPQDAYRFDGNRHAGQLLKRWLESPETDISRHVELANELNISPSSVSRWLVGNRRPRPHTLRRLKNRTGLEFYGWQSLAPRSPFESSGPHVSEGHAGRPLREATHMELLCDQRMSVSGISEALFRPADEVERAVRASGRSPATPAWPPENERRLRNLVIGGRSVRQSEVGTWSPENRREILARQLGVSLAAFEDEMHRQGLTLERPAWEEEAPSRCAACGQGKREQRDPPGALCAECNDHDALKFGGRIEIATVS